MASASAARTSLGKTFKAIQDGFSTPVAEFPPEDKADAHKEELKKKMANGARVQPTPAAKPKTAAKKAAKKEEPPPPAAPPLEVGETMDPETGEITSEEPQGPEDYDQAATTTASPMDEREQLVAKYLDLCEAKDVKPKPVSGMSNDALKGHIAVLTGK
jgi:hypothetical protein